jgi:hypothetical protein
MDENLAVKQASGPVADFAYLLAESKAITIVSQTQRSIDFLIATDLPGRLTMLADNETLLVDLYIYNAVLLTGPPRQGLVQSMLRLNHSTSRGLRFVTALDERDFLFLWARKRSSAAAEQDLEEWLQYLSEQAYRVRELAAALAWEDLEPGIEFGFETVEEV